MATIANNLLSLAATKAKLKQNLIYAGVDASAENNFSDLVDMPFDAGEEFSPDEAWPQDLSTWTPDGGIGLIVSDFGLGKTSFIVDTDSADYTVVVNDGTNDLSTTNYASGAQCDVSLTPGLGTITHAVKITSASPIRRFRIVRSTGVTINQSAALLYFYGKLSTLNNCANMFYPAVTCRCSILQAVHIDSTANVTNMSYMFHACCSLRSVPAVMDTANVTNMSNMFYACYSLRSVPAVMDTAKVTNMSTMFYACYSLRAVPAVMDTSLVTNMSSMFYACCSLRSVPAVLNAGLITDGTDFGVSLRSLSRDLLDLSPAAITTKLKITEAQGLKGLLVSSSATWTGTAPQIDITDCGLDRTALQNLFGSLGTIAGKTIKVTGNPGTADLTAGDLAIATDKGWTVTTT